MPIIANKKNASRKKTASPQKCHLAIHCRTFLHNWEWTNFDADSFSLFVHFSNLSNYLWQKKVEQEGNVTEWKAVEGEKCRDERRKRNKNEIEDVNMCSLAMNEYHLKRFIGFVWAVLIAIEKHQSNDYYYSLCANRFNGFSVVFVHVFTFAEFAYYLVFNLWLERCWYQYFQRINRHSLMTYVCVCAVWLTMKSVIATFY